jgi:hypothetical protein
MDYSYAEARHLPEFTDVNSDVKGRDFISTVESYYTELKEADRPRLIRFVLQAKIQGAAKTKIGEATVETLEDVKTLLLAKCGSVETIETLGVKMTNIGTSQAHSQRFSVL